MSLSDGKMTGTINATLCYLRSKGHTLMLFRNKKAGDIHQGKWNGLGGKMKSGETPEECAIREIHEESGLTARSVSLRGILTFPNFDGENDWLVFVFVADDFSGDLIESPEGMLHWIPDGEILRLPLWEGDKIFLEWLNKPLFFSGKFNYDRGRLKNYSVVFH